MSELARREVSLEELVEQANPVTGELVSMEDPLGVCEAFVNAGEMIERLQEFIEWLKAILVEEAKRQGKRTLRVGSGYVATVTGGYPTFPDMQALVDELRRAGLDDDRLRELVKEKRTYRVDGNVLRQLRGANPEYAEAINRAAGPPTRLTASVKRDA